MTGGRHIDLYLPTALHEVKNAKCGEDLVHSGGNDIEHRQEEVALETEIDVDTAHLGRGGPFDFLTHFVSPTFVLSDGINLGGMQHRVVEHRMRQIADFSLKDVVERRRRIDGADGDGNILAHAAGMEGQAEAETVVFPTPPLPTVRVNGASSVGQFAASSRSSGLSATFASLSLRSFPSKNVTAKGQQRFPSKNRVARVFGDAQRQSLELTTKKANGGLKFLCQFRTSRTACLRHRPIQDDFVQLHGHRCTTELLLRTYRFIQRKFLRRRHEQKARSFAAERLSDFFNHPLPADDIQVFRGMTAKCAAST